GPAGCVGAVPILQHRAPEALREERVVPRAKTPRDERGEAHVRARPQHALEMSAALQEWHVQQRLAVDLQEIERGEDPPPAVLPCVRVALVVDLEIALVPPIAHENAVHDRGRALRVRDDRVVELARAIDRPRVAAEARLTLADPDEDPGTCPLGLEDVALRLRTLADEPGALWRDLRAEKRRHPSDSSVSGVRAGGSGRFVGPSGPLDSQNVRSIIPERPF